MNTQFIHGVRRLVVDDTPKIMLLQMYVENELSEHDIKFFWTRNAVGHHIRIAYFERNNYHIQYNENLHVIRLYQLEDLCCHVLTIENPYEPNALEPVLDLFLD